MKLGRSSSSTIHRDADCARTGPLLRMAARALFTIDRADELALRKHLRAERGMSEKEILGLGSAYFWKRCRRHSRSKEEQARLFDRTVRVSMWLKLFAIVAAFRWKQETPAC